MLRLVLISAALFVSHLTEASAAAVYHPPCEDQRDTVNSKKQTLDKCIEKVETTILGGDPEAKSKAEKELPCATELTALINAGKSLNQCMEDSAWWLSKSKKGKP